MTRSSNRYHMAFKRSALSCHQVVISIFLVNMGTFRVFLPSIAFPYLLDLGDSLSSLDVDLELTDSTIQLDQGTVTPRTLNVSPPIIIEENAWVNALKIKVYWI